MTYALRHPEQPAKLILSNTQARLDVERTLAAFERRGGTAARNAASAFLRGQPDQQTFLRHALTYARVCGPLYSTTGSDPNAVRRIMFNGDLAWVFHRPPDGPWHTANLLPLLPQIRCPTLVLAGEEDPICPIADAEELVAALPPEAVRFVRFPGCSHALPTDAPQAYFAAIRAFLTHETLSA